MRVLCNRQGAIRRLPEASGYGVSGQYKRATKKSAGVSAPASGKSYRVRRQELMPNQKRSVKESFAWQPRSRRRHQSTADAAARTQGGDLVHAHHQRSLRDRHPQRLAGNDAAGCGRDPAAAEPNGTCLGISQPGLCQQAQIHRGARDDRVQCVFTRKGLEAR
jgi:hypothetical protein